VDPFYAVARVIARFWIWFFFERVVHDLATAVLFRNRLVARLLVVLGVIPVCPQRRQSANR
jgi:hypothetical protein